MFCAPGGELKIADDLDYDWFVCMSPSRLSSLSSCCLRPKVISYFVLCLAWCPTTAFSHTNKTWQSTNSISRGLPLGVWTIRAGRRHYIPWLKDRQHTMIIRGGTSTQWWFVGVLVHNDTRCVTTIYAATVDIAQSYFASEHHTSSSFWSIGISAGWLLLFHWSGEI